MTARKGEIREDTNEEISEEVRSNIAAETKRTIGASIGIDSDEIAKLIEASKAGTQGTQ